MNNKREKITINNLPNFNNKIFSIIYLYEQWRLIINHRCFLSNTSLTNNSRVFFPRNNLYIIITNHLNQF